MDQVRLTGNCGTCKFAEGSEGFEGKFCHLNPPVYAGATQQGPMFVFPVVNPNQWCSHWTTKLTM